MERYNITVKDNPFDGCPYADMVVSDDGAYVRYDDAQRALDAEREKVKELEAMYRQQLDERDKRIGELAESAKIWMERRNTLEADNARLLAAIDEGLTGTDISLAVRTVEEMYADNAALRLKVQGLDRTLADVYQQRDGLQAQLADRDAMILQMGEQAAVLAKENMAVKAQLRQVEGERDHAKKMEAVQKEVADNQTWHVQKLKGWRDTVTLALQRPGGARFEDVPGHIKALVKEHDTLRQLVEALQAQVKELEESRDAWKASQECSEKAYMALVNQIPAERFDYDPVNVALLDGAKEQEIIGRKQIADLQDLLKRTDENREQWRKLCQEAQSQLTQRTAELEAAKTRAHESESKATEFSVKLQQAREERDNLRLRIQAVDKEHEQLAVDRQKMTGTVESLLTERDNLRAELERVRGERDRHRNVTKAC